MKKFKKYLKKFMFYFGAFAVTLIVVAGSKVALFLVTQKPNEDPIYSEETTTEDNALTKVMNKVMETDNAKMGLSMKITPQDTNNAVDINANLYANIQDGKTNDGLNFNNIKLSLNGCINFQNKNIPFDICYVNDYVYANVANVNFKLSTSDAVQDITKILNLTILDKLGVSITLPDMFNMTFSQDILMSLANKITETDVEDGKELTLDLFGYGDLVIKTNNDYLPQSIYSKNININGTQLLANIDTNLKAEKQEINEPDNKNEVMDVTTLTQIVESVDNLTSKGEIGGELSLNVYDHNFNIDYSLDFSDPSNIQFYAKTKLGSDYIILNYKQNKVYVSYKNLKYYYNTADFNLDKIVNAIKFYLSKFNIEIPELNFDKLIKEIDLEYIVGVLSNVNDIKVSGNGLLYEKQDYMISLNLTNGEIDNIKATYKDDLEFTLTLNKTIESVEITASEYKNIKDEKLISKIIDGILYNKQIAFDINATYNNENVIGKLQIDLTSDLDIQLTLNILDTNVVVAYIDKIMYVEIGDILRAKGTLDDITSFVKQFDLPKLEFDYNYDSLVNIYTDIIDLLNQHNVTIDFVKDSDGIAKIAVKKDNLNIQFSVSDNFEITYQGNGEYKELTDIANFIKSIVVKVANFEPIYKVSVAYKQYEITGQIKYINKKLEGEFNTTIFEKQLQIKIKDNTLYINFDGFKAKCSFKNAKDLFEYIMTFAKDDIEKTFGKIELREPDIAGILSELKIKISGNIAQVLYNDITLQLDSELATFNLAYNDVTLIANKTTNFNIDVTDSEYFDLYELKELSKAVYNTLKNMCISGNAIANIKLFGELNTLNVNYKIGYIDGNLLGYINTNFKGLDINIYMENNDLYFDIIGIKLHINTSELENIVSWINTTFDKNYSIDTKESLFDKLKNIHFDIVKSVKSTSGQTYVELKDNFDINLIFDDYIRQVEFYQNENGATLKCTNFEKFDLSSLNKSEYKKYTSYTTLIENVYNQIMEKQFNVSVSAKKYQNSKLIKSISGDVDLDVTNMLNAYVNILGLDEQITAYYSNKALYFCYGGDTGLKIKIREDAVQEIMSIMCSALNVDVSAIPLLNDFLTKENIDTDNLSEIMPKIDTNPLKLLEYVETIHYTDTDLTIVIKGEKLGEYANGKDITIKICYTSDKMTNIEINNLITNVETNEMINANIVFNDYTGVKQVENASKYIDLSDSKDLIRAFVNTSNLNDFHIVGGVKLNIDIGIKFDAATVGIDAKVKKIITKTKEFNEDTGELIETEKTSWDGYIEVCNYPIITGVNNATSNGVGLLSRKRVITIYFHEGNIYLSTVDNKSGACKEFSRMTKITPTYLVDNLKYYMNYLLGFTDSIQSKINEAIDKSQSYTGKTDYGNIVKQYTHSGSKHTIVVNLAEITHNSDIGTLTVIIETSNALTSDKKDYFKRLDIDMQLLDGMISLKTDSSSSQSDNQSLFLVDIGQSLDISKATTFVENYDNVLGFGLNGEYEKEGTGSWKQVNKDERKIYFVDNDVVISTQTGIVASKITFPNMTDKVSDDGVTRTVCTFAGWYTDPNYKTLFSQDTFASSNLTLFAKWDIKEQKKYTKINFVTNDERVTVDALVGFVGDNLALPVLANISEDIDEYTSKLKVFLGWQTIDGQDYTYTTFQDGEITLYAKWEEIITKTYDLTIYHNADVIYFGKVKADEHFDISTLEIYELYTKVYSTCDFDDNNLVTSFVVSQNTTWYIRNAYYVTVVSSYTTQNGDPYYNKQTLYEGSTLSLPTYSNYEENKGTYTVEYKFKGYKLEGSDTLITTNSVTTVSGDKKYTAVWDVKEYCIVTFDVSAWVNPSWWKPTKILPAKFVSRSTVSNTNNTNQVKIERNTNLVFSSYVATCKYKYGTTYNFKTIAWGDSVQNLYDGSYSGATSLKITGNITLKPIWVHA